MQDTTLRPQFWADIPDQQWNDWRWQLSHRVNHLEILETFIDLTDEEIDGITAKNRYG